MQKERGGSENEFLVIEDSLSELCMAFEEKRGYPVDWLIGFDAVGDMLCAETDMDDFNSGEYVPCDEDEEEYIAAIRGYVEEDKHLLYKLISDDEYYQETLDLEKNAPGGALRVLGEMHAKMVRLAKPIDIKFN
jgi:hypothetical protein